MITESTVYWILKLDDIRFLLIFIAVIAILIAFSLMIPVAFCWDEWKNGDKKQLNICKKYFFVLIAVFSASVLAFTFTPTTKQMAMIKIIPAIANSEIADDIPQDAKDIYKLGVEAIKEQLKTQGENNE